MQILDNITDRVIDHLIKYISKRTNYNYGRIGATNIDDFELVCFLIIK